MKNSQKSIRLNLIHSASIQCINPNEYEPMRINLNQWELILTNPNYLDLDLLFVWIKYL